MSSYSRCHSQAEPSRLGQYWEKAQAVWEFPWSGKPHSARRQPSDTGAGGHKLGEAFCVACRPVKSIISICCVLNVCVSTEGYVTLTKFSQPLVFKMLFFDGTYQVRRS